MYSYGAGGATQACDPRTAGLDYRRVYFPTEFSISAQMILKPDNIADLSNSLMCANTRAEKVLSVDLKALNRLLEHKSEDMTATIAAGITLAAFQKDIGQRGQW